MAVIVITAQITPFNKYRHVFVGVQLVNTLACSDFFVIFIYISNLSRTESLNVQLPCRILLPQCHKSALTTCELALLEYFGYLVHQDCDVAIFKVI